MEQSAIYRINEPSVIAEVIEGEAIILNFESGSYYSLNESGKAIWADILAGHCREDILARLGASYALAPADIDGDVNRALQTLLDEQLIVPVEQTAGSPAGAAVDFRPEQPYAAPALQKFTDLQELLLLDPIHEVTPAAAP